jgi:hypothetical protein
MKLKVDDALAELFRNAFPEGATRDQIDDLLADRRALIARVAELEAIVEKLPKTADGGPILLDEPVFYDNRDKRLRYAMSDDDFPEMQVTSLYVLGNAKTGVSDMREIGLLGRGSSIQVRGLRAKCFSSRPEGTVTP